MLFLVDTTVAWLQGICLSILEQRGVTYSKSCYQWGNLDLLKALTQFAPLEFASKVFSALFPFRRRTYHVQHSSIVQHRWSAHSTGAQTSCDSVADGEHSKSVEYALPLAVADPILPCFVPTDMIVDIGEHTELRASRCASRTLSACGAAADPMLRPLRLHAVACYDNEDLLMQQLKLGAFSLPKQIFLKKLGQQQQQRRMSCCQKGSTQESSTACTTPDHQLIMHHRTNSAFFQAQRPLLLPEPLFLPQALEIGLFCEKGHRASNEDMAFGMKLDPAMHHASCFQKAVCWGLFDGHGGVEVAEHLTEWLPELVAKRCNTIKEQGVEEVATIMLGLEDDLALRYHSEWLPEGRDPGSTALVATIMDDALLVANVGDCRLLLISEAVDHLGNRTAFVSKTTSDHHCGRNPDEARRVLATGTEIDFDGYIGSVLEVSRSIGDFQTKGELGSGVILADPEVYTWKLGPQESLAVAVTDGISGCMDDTEICNMVCKLLNDKKHLNDPAHAAKELATFAAFAKQSSDNCSAVVVLLKEQPPPEPARRRLFGRK